MLAKEMLLMLLKSSLSLMQQPLLPTQLVDSYHRMLLTLALNYQLELLVLVDKLELVMQLEPKDQLLGVFQRVLLHLASQVQDKVLELEGLVLELD